MGFFSRQISTSYHGHDIAISGTVGGNLKSSTIKLYSDVAKEGELQSQGVKGEAVVAYRNPLTTLDLKFSGFPVG